jgi:CRP-like cAMP-binding protein
MEQVRKYLDNISTQSDADWHFFSSRLVRQEFPKKRIILRTGQVENYLSFIEKGIIRFYVPKEENDLTFSFAFSNSFVSAYDSFLVQQPALYHVETLTETVLWRLSYKDMQEVYEKTTIGNLIGRRAGEDLFLKKSRRELSLLSESAEDRYLKLFTEQSHLIKEIPLKYISSYIGITPQALSRIRRRIS